jgi:AcrR family transcriptional regulator
MLICRTAFENRTPLKNLTPFEHLGHAGRMGIKERHERDHEAVERAILDAARDLFVSEGYPSVSIRKIAERIEYSPAALYAYFPSKDDIFLALADEGFRLLSRMMLCDDERRHDEPLARVRDSFWHLYEFSREHPEYFALMFIDRSVPRLCREYQRLAFAGEIPNRLIVDIQRCIDAHIFPASLDATVAFRMLMTSMLGAAATRLSQRLPSGENPDLIAADFLDVTLAGLQSGVALRSKGLLCVAEELEPPSVTVKLHREEKA